MRIAKSRGQSPVSRTLPMVCFAPHKKTRSSTLFLKAGDGNRTHVSSLEGWCSTIELHPHIYKAFGPRNLLRNAQNRNRTSDTRIFSPLLYQLSYLGLHVPRCSFHRFSQQWLFYNHIFKMSRGFSNFFYFFSVGVCPAMPLESTSHLFHGARGHL